MNTRTSTTHLGAGLALLLTALSAPAQDSAPVIRELQIDNRRVTSVPQGGVVTAIGRNFHQCPALPEPEPGQPPPRNTCRHDELEVQVDNKPVLLLESTFERVTFIIPQDTPVGRKRLKISIRGRGDATSDLEVADKLTDEQKRLQEQTEGGGGRAPDVEQLIRDQFRISMFELKRDAAGARFEIAGVAGKVPEGFTMVVTLSINQRDIAQNITIISSNGGQGTFRVTFGPYTKQLLFGNFAATCLFELRKQPKLRVRDFRRNLKPEEAQVYDRIERREFLQVGTTQEVADQTTAMQNHYRSHAEELGKLLGEMEKAYGSGCRQHFKQAGQANYDEAAWTAYITQMGFAAARTGGAAATPPPVDAALLNAYKSDFRFATRNGHFKADEYAQWATDTFVPALTAQFRKHRDFNDSTIASIEPRGELPADYLVSIVLETFKEYTRNLYDRAKLEVPENLRTVPNVDPVPAQAMSRRFFEAQKRLLLRTVGLRHLVPEGAD